MQIIVRFHAIKSEMELSSEFWNKRSSTPPYRDIRTQIASVIFLVIYISYTNFCAISFTRNRDQLIPKILESYYNATCWVMFTKS